MHTSSPTCSARPRATRFARAKPARRLNVHATQIHVPGSLNGNQISEACSKFKVAAFSSKRYVRDFLEKPLKSQFPNSNFIEAPLDIDTAVLAAGYDAVVLFVNDQANKQTLEVLANGGTKVVALRCAGYDRVDLEAAEQLGLTVVRVPTYSPQSVAEHAVAMMFALNRNLHRAYLRVQQGNYTLSGLVGMQISGKTVGVVGTGAIGAEACRLFKGLGMRVLAYDLRPNPACEALGVEYLPVDEMLPQCHVVSLHCPLLPSTRHIIDAEAIRKMRHGAVLINVSRGGLVDSDAVLDGLENGQLGGLGLDVYENEESLFFEDFTSLPMHERMRHWDRRFRTLLSYPQVLVTPHSAFLTEEALHNIAATTVANLQDFVTGAPLANQVKPLRK